MEKPIKEDHDRFCFEAPQEIIDELQAIQDRINEKGFAYKKDAERHLNLARQYQVCNTCGRPYRDIKMGMLAKVPGYNHKQYDFCFTPTCMQCEMMSWMMDPEVNPNIKN